MAHAHRANPQSGASLAIFAHATAVENPLAVRISCRFIGR